MLNVDYVVSGAIQRDAKRLSVTVELTETRTARIVWAEVMKHKLDDAFLVLEEIGNRIVASVASEIETIERNRAILRPPSSLDAWEAHHRGLWHMYRFSKADNERARHFFETAVRLDPTFARAYAGLSFTHFQNAFQGWAKRQPAIDRAFEAAGQGLMADDRDPAAHWAMGRALWLRGQDDQSVVELERAIDLSPNFALGHYTLAFVNSQTGDPKAAIASSDHSRRLSPFDPLLFGMLGARAMALVRLGRFEEAAEWAVKAASRPNAHPHILAIAAFSLALTGSLEQARVWAADDCAAPFRVRHRRLPRGLPVRSERRGAVPQRGQAHRNGLTIAGDQEARASLPPRRRHRSSVSSRGLHWRRRGAPARRRDVFLLIGLVSLTLQSPLPGPRRSRRRRSDARVLAMMTGGCWCAAPAARRSMPRRGLRSTRRPSRQRSRAGRHRGLMAARAAERGLPGELPVMAALARSGLEQSARQSRRTRRYFGMLERLSGDGR